jgi:outer membrane protein assembly factor BamB
MRATPLLLIALGSTFVHATDWPVWRGLDRSGISTEAIKTDFGGDSPPVVWKAELGIGFSSFVVAKGIAYSTGHADDNDTLFAIDASTGKEVWKHSYPAELGDKYYEGGTSATPTVDGDCVYHLSRWGDCMAFDAASGKILWSKNIATELKIDPPSWGFASSPLVQGEQLILNVGARGAALEKKSGKVLWSSDASAETGYCTALPTLWNGKPALITANTEAYLAVNPTTGEQLWSLPWPTRYGINAADVIIKDKQMLVSTGYGKGCGLFDLSGPQPKELYQHRQFRMQMNPAILIGDHVYGIDGDENSKPELKCMDWATGKIVWSKAVPGGGAVSAAKDILMVIGGKGELDLVKANPQAYESLSTMQVLAGRCWSVPTLANGRLYLRNAQGSAVCLKMD